MQQAVADRSALVSFPRETDGPDLKYTEYAAPQHYDFHAPNGQPREIWCFLYSASRC